MIGPTIRKNLFTLVAAYQKATGNSLKTISNKFYGNANFLNDLRRPKGDPKRASISIDKLDAFVQKMKKVWPVEAEWPMLRAVFMDAPAPRSRKR
jgi:hypothetical protein